MIRFPSCVRVGTRRLLSRVTRVNPPLSEVMDEDEASLPPPTWYDHKPAAIGRQPWRTEPPALAAVSERLGRPWRSTQTTLRVCKSAADIREGAAGRDDELRGPMPGILEHPLQHGNRRTRDLQGVLVKCHRVQRSRARIRQVSWRRVVRLRGALNQGVALPGLQRLRDVVAWCQGPSRGEDQPGT